MDYDFSNNSTDTITITSPACRMCGKDNKIVVDRIHYLMWDHEGALLQDAFPYLDSDSREIIKTGIHPKCWDRMFDEM